MSQSPFVKCPDCSFITSTQGHLGIHRSKMHKCATPRDVKSVNIIRLFPEGKPHYCCLCDNIIASFPNFKRHFATSHKGISLIVSAKCVICDREFSKPSGAGVHIKRVHQIGKHQSYPHSPSPVMSYVNTTVNIPTTTPSARSRSLRSFHLLTPQYLVFPSARQSA